MLPILFLLAVEYIYCTNGLNDTYGDLLSVIAVSICIIN